MVQTVDKHRAAFLQWISRQALDRGGGGAKHMNDPPSGSLTAVAAGASEVQSLSSISTAMRLFERGWRIGLFAEAPFAVRVERCKAWHLQGLGSRQYYYALPIKNIGNWLSQGCPHLSDVSPRHTSRGLAHPMKTEKLADLPSGAGNVVSGSFGGEGNHGRRKCTARGTSDRYVCTWEESNCAKPPI
jgi:hypothetical protein